MYQSDLVVTELRKAPEQRLTKEGLQRATALGADDLRTGIQQAVDAGLVRETDEGYEYVEDGVIAVAQTQADPDPDPEPAAGPDPEPEELDETREAAAGKDPAYRATYVIDVEYKTDEPGAGDEAGLADAAAILEQLQGAVLEKYPDLTVRGRVQRVVVFDGVREIFAADG